MTRRTSRTVTASVCIERSGVEVELDLIGQYHPGDPGKTYGPPESCYPPEGAEIHSFTISIAGKMWDGTLTADEEDKAIDALIEDGDNCDDDGPEYEKDEDPPDYWERNDC